MSSSKMVWGKQSLALLTNGVNLAVELTMVAPRPKSEVLLWAVRPTGQEPHHTSCSLCLPALGRRVAMMSYVAASQTYISLTETLLFAPTALNPVQLEEWLVRAAVIQEGVVCPQTCVHIQDYKLSKHSGPMGQAKQPFWFKFECLGTFPITKIYMQAFCKIWNTYL